eukprot:3154528-Rhodomonas_salina.2
MRRSGLMQDSEESGGFVFRTDLHTSPTTPPPAPPLPTSRSPSLHTFTVAQPEMCTSRDR